MVHASSLDLESVLARVQDDIAANGPGSYYPIYRCDEMRFWSHIPAWIAALPAGIRVLDVGTAYGTLALFARRVLDAEVIALDALSLYHPKTLFEREGIAHIVRDVERDSIADLGHFDLIIFTEVLEHLNFQPLPTLTKLFDALIPGGLLVLSTPDAGSAWGRQLKYYDSLTALPVPTNDAKWIDDHVWQFDRPELMSSLGAAGFRVQAMRSAPGMKPGWTHFNVRAKRPLSGQRPWMSGRLATLRAHLPQTLDLAILRAEQRRLLRASCRRGSSQS